MNINERRKYKRHDLQEGTFAAVLSNYLIGQVKNISREGIAFTYVDLEDQIFSRDEMEIFSDDNNFFLKKIPFKVVSNIDMEIHVPYTTPPIKQISGEFAELTGYQKSQLDIFLQNLATTEAFC